MSQLELRSNNGSHIIDLSILIAMCVGVVLRIFPWLNVEESLYVAAGHGRFDIDGGGRQEVDSPVLAFCRCVGTEIACTRSMDCLVWS
jgi:hypothetical protein